MEFRNMLWSCGVYLSHVATGMYLAGQAFSIATEKSTLAPSQESTLMSLFYIELLLVIASAVNFNSKINTTFPKK